MLVASLLALDVSAGCTAERGDRARTAESRRRTPDRRRSPTQPPSPRPSAEQAELDRRLIEAAWDDDVDRARRLIGRGADVNTQDETQQSAYLIATSEGYYELLELTLRHGAQVEAQGQLRRHRPDPRRRARPLGRRRAARAGRRTGGPRQQPRVDRAARGDHPRRRQRRGTSTPSASSSPRAPTSPCPRPATGSARSSTPGRRGTPTSPTCSRPRTGLDGRRATGRGRPASAAPRPRPGTPTPSLSRCGPAPGLETRDVHRRTPLLLAADARPGRRGAGAGRPRRGPGRARRPPRHALAGDRRDRQRPDARGAAARRIPT